MSLINQMLRDLDARHAPAVDRVALPADVRVLLPERDGRRLLLAGVLLALALVAARWYWPEEPAAPPAVALPQPSPVAPPAAPAAADVAPPALVAVVPADNVAAAVAPAPTPAPTRATAPVAARVANKKPTVEIAAAREQIAAPKDAAVAKGAAAKVPDQVPAPAPAALPPAPKEAVPPAEPASIDKRPRSGSSNEAADNEYRRAMAALRRGAMAEAQDGLRATLRLDARHISARQALLSLLVEQQQWTEGQALMVDGLALDPAQVGWTIALARMQLETGKLAEAAETLSRHARYAEHSADYQAFHALLLQKLKRSRESAERYRAALALKPAESRWWYGLGLALEAEHKPQEAHDAFLKARDSGNLPPELTAAVEQRLR